MPQRLRAVLPVGADVEVPGGLNMWLFVIGELFIFAFYFFVYMRYRADATAAFVASQRHLDLAVGTANTIVLLTSSYLVALAVQAARDGLHERARRLVGGTMALAALFAAVKLGEWTAEVRSGHTFADGGFFMFYFALTGVHLFHVVVGVGILAFLRRELATPAFQRQFVIEAGATYWHMVDVVWIVLFALLYVLR